MENIFVEFLPPWIETGLQPAFYDKESGTVLQQTARMYARVNMLIRMFNKLSKQTKTEITNFEESTTETVNDYINKFNELHDYVHDYFDNLDVQEEINNKLDDMAEAGTLQEIITTYIQSNVAWTFDTVAEMKQGTNFVDGSYAQTLGFYSLNDGGGALYKIREKEENETANNITTFDIGTSNLVAELNRDVEINILQCGAKKDGTASISPIVNYIVTNLSDLDIYIPNGDYLVHETIYLGPATQIRGENMWKTRLFTDATIAILENKEDDIATLYIHDLYLDGNNVGTKGIYLYRNRTNLVYNDSRSFINNILVKKCTDWCIQIGDPSTSSNVIEITVDNIYVHQYTGGGIYISRCSDSHFSNIRSGSGLASSKPAIQVEGYNLQIINSKAFLAGTVDSPKSGWYFNGGANIIADIEAQANSKYGVEINQTKDSKFNIVADKNCLVGESYAGVLIKDVQNCEVNAIISNNVVTDQFITNVGCKLVAPKKLNLVLNCNNDIAKAIDLSEYNTNQLFTVNSKININGYSLVDVTPEFNGSITVPTGITLTKINNESFLLSGTSTTDQNIWLSGSYGSHTVLSKLSADCIYNMSTGNSKVGLAVWNYVTNLGGGYDRIVEGSDTDVTGMMLQIKANVAYNHIITPKVLATLNKPTETFA